MTSVVAAPAAPIADVSPAAPPRARFTELDGIRGMACLMVLAAHTAMVTAADTNLAGGQILQRFEVSVPIFFVLSGFLIYRPFVAARRNVGREPGLARYTRARVLRIIPAYWFALLAAVVVTPLVTLQPTLHALHEPGWWRYFTFTQVYSTRTSAQGISQAWTLCVEAPFYVLVPLWAAFWARRPGGGRQREAVALLAIGLISATLRTVTFAAPGLIGGYYPFVATLGGTALWLVAGMALAIWSVQAQLNNRTAPGARACWAAAAALLLFLSFGAGLPRSATVVPSALGVTLIHVLDAAIAVLLVLPFAARRRRSGSGGVIARALSSRPLRWLGQVSYGFYLWHLIVLGAIVKIGYLHLLPGDPFVTTFVIAAVATTAAAAVSFYVIERPALRLR